MSDEQRGAVREVFRSAIAPMSAAELNELIMAPYRELVEDRNDD